MWVEQDFWFGSVDDVFRIELGRKGVGECEGVDVRLGEQRLGNEMWVEIDVGGTGLLSWWMVSLESSWAERVLQSMGLWMLRLVA